MTDDKVALVDTNVLLSATAPLRPLHRAALTVLNDWHDANIVATALTSGVTRLVTANAGDFNRFAADIEPIDLASIDPTTPVSPRPGEA